jgi:abhydrolase domain-containing protein 13
MPQLISVHFFGEFFRMAASLFSYLRLPVIVSSSLAALGSGFLYFKQNDLIYPRHMPAGARTLVPEPQDFQIESAESLQIYTSDHETLHAYLLRPTNISLREKVTILMLHGNAGNIGHRLPIGKVLAESLGCNVFMPEYRGYGRSTGTPDEAGLAADAQTALDYLRNRADLQDTKLLVYGQSLGGAVTIRLVAENQDAGDIAGIILENTFTCIRKLIPTAFPPAKYLVRLCHQLWPSEDTLPKITTDMPILFLSGLKDEIVPASMMKSLYDICKLDRKIWRDFPNGHHNDTVAEPGYFDAIWAFLNEVVLSGRSNSREGKFSQQEPTNKQNYVHMS